VPVKAPWLIRQKLFHEEPEAVILHSRRFARSFWLHSPCVMRKCSWSGLSQFDFGQPDGSLYEQEHNETISVEYTGQLLRQSGYATRKARKVLTSPDPHYREKVDRLPNTLQNLKPGELFFVDELGPLRAKKYGGAPSLERMRFLPIRRSKHTAVSS
jgi:hypothetical protein